MTGSGIIAVLGFTFLIFIVSVAMALTMYKVAEKSE